LVAGNQFNIFKAREVASFARLSGLEFRYMDKIYQGHFLTSEGENTCTSEIYLKTNVVQEMLCREEERPLPLNGDDISVHPSTSLFVIGITGTNGKTTVSHLIGEVLKKAGCTPFVLGTLNSGNKDLSTPESVDIAKFMRAHLAKGGTHFVMEVTSEGIDQGRINGIDFDMKILTNITQDHLDYHKTFEHYEQTKLDFMRAGNCCKLFPNDFEGEPIDFTTKLLGNFNLLNIKAAARALRHMGILEKHTRQTLSTCAPPRGRFESVDLGQPYMVLVDYAHTPDGLKNVLEAAKKIAVDRNGRLLVLFGCGGDRDRGKRPKMGKIASDMADFLAITDDNPRSEDGDHIIGEIQRGFTPGFHDYVLIKNRKQAIAFIINNSQKNDVIVLAGKGHELYQEFATETLYFDDREEASKVIRIKSGQQTQAPLALTA